MIFEAYATAAQSTVSSHVALFALLGITLAIPGVASLYHLAETCGRKICNVDFVDWWTLKLASEALQWTEIARTPGGDVKYSRPRPLRALAMVVASVVPGLSWIDLKFKISVEVGGTEYRWSVI